MLFIDEYKHKYPPIVCFLHEHMLHHSFYPSPTRIHVACSKVDKDLEDSEDLEELRHLTFKESM